MSLTIFRWRKKLFEKSDISKEFRFCSNLVKVKIWIYLLGLIYEHHTGGVYAYAFCRLTEWLDGRLYSKSHKFLPSHLIDQRNWRILNIFLPFMRVKWNVISAYRWMSDTFTCMVNSSKPLDIQPNYFCLTANELNSNIDEWHWNFSCFLSDLCLFSGWFWMIDLQQIWYAFTEAGYLKMWERTRNFETQKENIGIPRGKAE